MCLVCDGHVSFLDLRHGGAGRDSDLLVSLSRDMGAFCGWASVSHFILGLRGNEGAEDAASPVMLVCTFTGPDDLDYPKTKIPPGGVERISFPPSCAIDTSGV